MINLRWRRQDGLWNYYRIRIITPLRPVVEEQQRVLVSTLNLRNQRSGATPKYASTTTSPLGKEMVKKNVPLLMLEHRPPYVATASLAYPMDLFRNVEKAKKMSGFRYIEIVVLLSLIGKNCTTFTTFINLDAFNVLK